MSEVYLNGRSTALMFLHAQTGLHPGSGTALGVVDLPVQRERHTQWPTIAGSALKGVLRDLCREQVKGEAPAAEVSRRRWANEEHEMLVTAFGPGLPDESSEHAGAVAVTDARILAFPVRSLRGVFAWVTCPAVLERLNRDLDLINAHANGGKIQVPQVLDNSIVCAGNSPLGVGTNEQSVVLEEFEFTKTAKDCGDWAKWIAKSAVEDEYTQNRLESHLAVISDNDFSHFVRHATEVVARIALDYNHKTVKEKLLFYQEFLPAETIFYSVILVSPSRKPQTSHPSKVILDFVRKCVDQAKVLQIGGDESTGKGLCTVRLLNGKDGA